VDGIVGLHFVIKSLYLFATVSLLCAVGFAAIERRRTERAALVRAWVGARWQGLRSVAFIGMSAVAVRWMAEYADRACNRAIIDCGRAPLLGQLVVAHMFCVLPLLALANVFMGGSPFLLECYLGTAGLVVFLLLTDSFRIFKAARGIAAAVAGGLLLVVLPVYAIRALLELALGSPVPSGFLASLFIVQIVYAAVVGLWTLASSGREGTDMGPLEKATARFAFAVPISFMLYWLGLLAGYFAVEHPVPVHGWRSLCATVVVGSAVFAATMALFDTARDGGLTRRLVTSLGALALAVLGTIAIAFLSSVANPVSMVAGVGASGAITLGPAFWVTHVPLVPWVGAAGLAAVLSIARAVAYAEWTVRRPCAAASVCLAAVGAIVFLVVVGVD